MTNWRDCLASEQLLVELNDLWPGRDTASDGTVGDARHMAESGPNGPGSGSDHNPWIVVAGVGVVRARDIDKDGIDADWLAEWLRKRGAVGDPRLTGGGYVIWDKRITTPNFSGWSPYSGADDHTGHIHVSFSRNRAGFDSTAAWNFAEEHPVIAEINAKVDQLLAALAPIERYAADGKTIVKNPVRQEIADIRTAQLAQK